MLRKFGPEPTKSDPCVYYVGQKEESLLIAIYVDDILVMTRDKNKIAKFKRYLAGNSVLGI